MKKIVVIFALAVIASSCISMKDSRQELNAYTPNPVFSNELITQSLFQDNESKISEENIRKILESNYKLPQNLRVAIVNLENNQQRRIRWNQEDYLSARETYLNIIKQHLESNSRVQSVEIIPSMMISDNPSFTHIRESAVRMQADLVLVYNVEGGTYSNYKMFKTTKFKAFSTTQLMLIDTRTGLVPFSKIRTEDFTTEKNSSDFNDQDAERRSQETATKKTLDGICEELNSFLSDR